MLRRIGLITLILVFVVAIGFGVKAHYTIHNVQNAHLFFTEDPEIECDIDGKRFTHRRIVRDGEIILDFWHEVPRDPKFTITAKSHGFGWAYIKLWGDINGEKFGDSKNWESEKLGSWSPLLPVLWMPGEENLEHFVMGDFNLDPNEYKYEAKGTVYLEPWIWDWSSALLVIPTGQWKPAGSKKHKEEDAEAKGSWTVDRDWEIEGSRSRQIPDDDEEEDDEDDSEEQGNADPTVPDRPGSFELTPYKYAIKLQWTDSASDGGSSITDYQYQKQSSRSNRKHWSSWSDWISAGTGNSTWVNGLSSGVDYAVRMRAVNNVGSSSVTGIKMVKTKE